MTLSPLRHAEPARIGCWPLARLPDNSLGISPCPPSNFDSITPRQFLAMPSASHLQTPTPSAPPCPCPAVNRCPRCCRLGADVVVHSLTKFISGASDIIGGAVCAADGDFVHALMDLRLGPLMLLGEGVRGTWCLRVGGTGWAEQLVVLCSQPCDLSYHRPACQPAARCESAGPTMDPRVAGELSLRIPHLSLRMREHSSRAQHYAERLEALGARVCYPGLPSHPQYHLLRQLANPGASLLAEAPARPPASQVLACGSCCHAVLLASPHPPSL